MNRTGAVVLLILSVFLWGCSQSKGDTPQTIAAKVYDLCQEGAYTKALPYYSGGEKVWEDDPATAKYVIDKSCFSRQAKRFKLETEQVKGEGASVRVVLYKDETDASVLKTLDYQFVKKDGRWLITEVG